MHPAKLHPGLPSILHPRQLISILHVYFLHSHHIYSKLTMVLVSCTYTVMSSHCLEAQAAFGLGTSLSGVAPSAMNQSQEAPL